jgi:hypothetical protein
MWPPTDSTTAGAFDAFSGPGAGVGRALPRERNSMSTETKQTHVVVRDDFRSPADGYHFNAWESLCQSFALDPETTVSITVREVEHD